MTSSELCKKVQLESRQVGGIRLREQVGRSQNCGGPGWDLGFVSRERQNHSRSYHTIFAFGKVTFSCNAKKVLKWCAKMLRRDQ